jgi:hypothetical protein
MSNLDPTPKFTFTGPFFPFCGYFSTLKFGLAGSFEMVNVYKTMSPDIPQNSTCCNQFLEKYSLNNWCHCLQPCHRLQEENQASNKLLARDSWKGRIAFKPFISHRKHSTYP